MISSIRSLRIILTAITREFQKKMLKKSKEYSKLRKNVHKLITEGIVDVGILKK